MPRPFLTARWGSLVADDVRRGVVFIRELVPRYAIATVARFVYNEPYLAVPLTHRIPLTANHGGSAMYGWRYRRESFVLAAEVTGPPHRPTPGSEAEFITEHYCHAGPGTTRHGGRALPLPGAKSRQPVSCRGVVRLRCRERAALLVQVRANMKLGCANHRRP